MRCITSYMIVLYGSQRVLKDKKLHLCHFGISDNQ